MALGKVSGIDWANLASVAGVAKANIAKVAGVEVPAASSGVLDSYTGAGAAYALFKLYSSYTGDCIRIRRASDSTETDIGFDGSGDLDTSAISSFCSGTTGSVVTVYDLSGNGYDLTINSGAESKYQIYASGSVITASNGYPMFTNSNDFTHGYFTNSSVDIADLIGSSQQYTIFAGVYEESFFGGAMLPFTTESTFDYLYIQTASCLYSFNSDSIYAQGSAAISTGSDIIVEGLFNSSSDITFYLNGSEDLFDSSTGTYAPTGTDTLSIMDYSTSLGFYGAGGFQALVIYPSNQSANRSGIYTAIYNKLNGI